MSHLKTFELYNANMELKNDVRHHLSQFPHLKYSINDTGDVLKITFSKSIHLDYKYYKGLLDPYKSDVISKMNPVRLELTGKKNLDSYTIFKDKTIVSNIESIDIPSLDINKLEVKIDTGATVSSIHSNHIKIDGNKVQFSPLDDRFTQFNGKMYKADLEDQIKVQSSNGEDEERPLIILEIILKGKKVKGFFTLSDRKELEYPILIGKDILSGNFIVDPAHI